jgi:hypothetical protein
MNGIIATSMTLLPTTLRIVENDATLAVAVVDVVVVVVTVSVRSHEPLHPAPNAWPPTTLPPLFTLLVLVLVLEELPRL